MLGRHICQTKYERSLKVLGISNPQDDIWLVYDGECPVCKTYCKYIRIREAVGRLHLVDARLPGPLMDEITAAGLDIDQGMVVKFKNAVYYGADAIHILTLLSTPSGFFNRMNYYLFSTKIGARLFYPLGKAFRNIVLKLLGIKYIENLKRNTIEKKRKEC
jgi:predicted DCC family thiol-disulfide oxidoreductase YuxK